MKLLIVDDEKLTREGILKSLPLEKLGFIRLSWPTTAYMALKLP